MALAIALAVCTLLSLARPAAASPDLAAVLGRSLLAAAAPPYCPAAGTAQQTAPTAATPSVCPPGSTKSGDR